MTVALQPFVPEYGAGPFGVLPSASYWALFGAVLGITGTYFALAGAGLVRSPYDVSAPANRARTPDDDPRGSHAGDESGHAPPLGAGERASVATHSGDEVLRDGDTDVDGDGDTDAHCGETTGRYTRDPLDPWEPR